MVLGRHAGGHQHRAKDFMVKVIWATAAPGTWPIILNAKMLAQPGREILQQRLGILQQPLIGVQAIHQLKDRVVQPVENKHPHQTAAAVIQGLKDLRRSQAAYQPVIRATSSITIIAKLKPALITTPTTAIT